jgi:hypothetical protein
MSDVETDIVPRLRKYYATTNAGYICLQAANEIERLRDEWNRMNLNLQAKVKYCEALEKRNAVSSSEGPAK